MTSRGTKVLLTGFGPFPGVERNATEEFVPELASLANDRLSRDNATIVHETLPTEWRKAPLRAAELIAKSRPDLILHFGVARGANGYVIERIARNTCSATLDAARQLPQNEFVESDGPMSLYATIPTQQIFQKLRLQGYPAQLSRSAGAYICNAVFYTSLRSAQKSKSTRRIGFIHLPENLSPKNSRDFTWEQALRGGVKLVEICMENSAIDAEPDVGPEYALHNNKVRSANEV